MSDARAVLTGLLADIDVELEHAVGGRCDGLWWVKNRIVRRLDALPPPSTGAVIPSRRTDPDTSRKAEPTAVKAGTQRAHLLAAFGLEAAADGLTDEEAADLTQGAVPYRSEFAKRCSELRAAGLIQPVIRLDTLEPLTRAGSAGHQRIVSAITPAGRAILATL